MSSLDELGLVHRRGTLECMLLCLCLESIDTYEHVSIVIPLCSKLSAHGCIEATMMVVEDPEIISTRRI